ncbi:hypothetical protein AGLY_006050, partial [Aphis glycines]
YRRNCDQETILLFQTNFYLFFDTKQYYKNKKKINIRIQTIKKILISELHLRTESHSGLFLVFGGVITRSCIPLDSSSEQLSSGVNRHSLLRYDLSLPLEANIKPKNGGDGFKGLVKYSGWNCLFLDVLHIQCSLHNDDDAFLQLFQILHRVYLNFYIRITDEIPFLNIVVLLPSLIVPPLFSGQCSGISIINGSLAFEFISVVSAFSKPRQIPKNGLRFSRHHLHASILPSTPLVPKPPGTMTPLVKHTCLEATSQKVDIFLLTCSTLEHGFVLLQITRSGLQQMAYFQYHQLCHQVQQHKPNNKININRNVVLAMQSENVPASMFRYGSILMDVTWTPQDFRSVPIDEAMMPLPTPLMTPPVTKMYFMIKYFSGQKESKNAENDRRDSKMSRTREQTH